LQSVFGFSGQSGMDLFDDLEIFVAVAERGSFSKAAEVLRLSRSRVSDSMRNLEMRLGARLFERTTRHVTATEAGRLFYVRARRAVEEARLGRDEIDAMVSEPTGPVRIGVPDAFSEIYLVPALAGFLAAYPKVTVELVASYKFVDLVEERLDLAIRIAQEPAPHLVVRKLGESRVIFCGSTGYLAKRGRPEGPWDVADHAIIGFSPLFLGREWRFRGPDGSVTVPIKPVIQCDSTMALRSAALANMGLAAMPDWLVRAEIANGDLMEVLQEWTLPPWGIYAVYPSNRLIPTRVRAVVEHIAAYLKTHLGP
jgi:DNA-binding transcriptional LysR family regulator